MGDSEQDKAQQRPELAVQQGWVVAQEVSPFREDGHSNWCWLHSPTWLGYHLSTLWRAMGH